MVIGTQNLSFGNEAAKQQAAVPFPFSFSFFGGRDGIDESMGGTREPQTGTSPFGCYFLFLCLLIFFLFEMIPLGGMFFKIDGFGIALFE